MYSMRDKAACSSLVIKSVLFGRQCTDRYLKSTVNESIIQLTGRNLHENIYKYILKKKKNMPDLNEA